MKRIVSLLCLALLSLGICFAKGEKQVVVFNVDLHCENCINKVEKSIAFEKGVKDLQCSLDSKTVKVTFDASQTNIPTLQAAFQKIGKTATVNEAATAAIATAAKKKTAKK